MIAIDGPDMNVEPKVLGELPPTPLSQPEKVTADRTPGEQGPRRAGQRSPTHLDGKPALDTERGPRGRERPAAGDHKSDQQWEPPGTRVSSSRGRREQELPSAGAHGSKNLQQQRPPGARASRRQSLQERRVEGTRGVVLGPEETIGRRGTTTGTPWLFGLQC